MCGRVPLLSIWSYHDLVNKLHANSELYSIHTTEKNLKQYIYIYIHTHTHTHIHNCCYCLVAKSCLTLCNPLNYRPTRLLCPWDFPGNNIGVGCHFLLQGIFPAQELNPHLLHWQVDSLPWATWEAYIYVYVNLYIYIDTQTYIHTYIWITLLYSRS